MVVSNSFSLEAKTNRHYLTVKAPSSSFTVDKFLGHPFLKGELMMPVGSTPPAPRPAPSEAIPIRSSNRVSTRRRKSSTLFTDSPVRHTVYLDCAPCTTQWTWAVHHAPHSVLGLCTMHHTVYLDCAPCTTQCTWAVHHAPHSVLGLCTMHHTVYLDCAPCTTQCTRTVHHAPHSVLGLCTMHHTVY